MNNFFLYMPVMWGIKTRHRTIKNKISFLFIDVFPSLYFTVIYNGITILNIVTYFCSFLFMYLLYEIGYICNDVITINKEDKPTYRLAEDNQVWCKNNVWKLIAFRIVCAIMIVIYMCNDGLSEKYMFFLGTLILFFYYIHNNIRGNLNTFSIILLGGVKYMVPICIFYGNQYNNITIFFIIMLAIVIPHALDYSQNKKLWGMKVPSNRSLFRFSFMLSILIIVGMFDYFCLVSGKELWFVMVVTMYRFIGVICDG